MFKLKNVSKNYKNFQTLSNINLDVQTGCNISILGPNACGKTTLLKIMANLITYDGIVTYNNENINILPRKILATKIAYMSQIKYINFNYTVTELVSLGDYANSTSLFAKNNSAKILNALESVDLLDKKNDLISTLSGGQLQRVFLAKILVQDPEVLLLDEPTNNLDIKHQYKLIENLKKWNVNNDKTIIAVFHDINLAFEFSHNCILMNNFKIEFYGNSKDIIKSDKLKLAYGLDIQKKMLNSLDKWL